MPKLDYNIYGNDDNGFAQRIAAESLGGQPNSGNEDYWMGDPANDDSCLAKANVGEESTGPLGDVPKLKGQAAGNFGDNEKFIMPQKIGAGGRHVKGPMASKADGYEDKYVPANHKQTTDTDKFQTTLFRKK